MYQSDKYYHHHISHLITIFFHTQERTKPLFPCTDKWFKKKGKERQNPTLDLPHHQEHVQDIDGGSSSAATSL